MPRDRPALTRREARALNRGAWLLARIRYARERRRLVAEYMQARNAGVGVDDFVAAILVGEGKRAPAD